jgi:hypothetical protein
MIPLSRNEKDLILDCCFGLTRTKQTIQVMTLLTHNEQAAAFHAGIQAALAPLETICPEPCPAELAECTVRLLCATAKGVRAVARVRTADFSFHELEDPRQYPGEFEAYDTGDAAVMELLPEGTD